MHGATLEEAQAQMRLENQTQAKGTAEHSVTTPVTSDLMTVKEAAETMAFAVGWLMMRLRDHPKLSKKRYISHD